VGSVTFESAASLFGEIDQVESTASAAAESESFVWADFETVGRRDEGELPFEFPLHGP